MRGPDHYLAAQEHLRLAEAAHLEPDPTRDAEWVGERIGLAQAHAMLALTAALAELDAAEGPGGGSATGRSAEDSSGWRAALVDDIDRDLVCDMLTTAQCGQPRPCPHHEAGAGDGRG